MLRSVSAAGFAASGRTRARQHRRWWLVDRRGERAQPPPHRGSSTAKPPRGSSAGNGARPATLAGRVWNMVGEQACPQRWHGRRRVDEPPLSVAHGNYAMTGSDPVGLTPSTGDTRRGDGQRGRRRGGIEGKTASRSGFAIRAGRRERVRAQVGPPVHRSHASCARRGVGAGPGDRPGLGERPAAADRPAHGRPDDAAGQAHFPRGVARPDHSASRLHGC